MTEVSKAILQAKAKAKVDLVHRHEEEYEELVSERMEKLGFKAEPIQTTVVSWKKAS